MELAECDVFYLFIKKMKLDCNGNVRKGISAKNHGFKMPKLLW